MYISLLCSERRDVHSPPRQFSPHTLWFTHTKPLNNSQCHTCGQMKINKSRPNIFVDIMLENMSRFNICQFPFVVEISKISICVAEVKMGKPSGIRTARKHVKNRRNQVWADKDYKKAHLGTRWKANPFGGASHAKVLL